MSTNEIASKDSLPRDAAASAWYLRWWLLASMLSGAALGLITLFASTPIYEARTKLVPVEISNLNTSTTNALGAIAGIAGLDLGTSSSRKFEALEILQSVSLIGSFIEDHELLPQLYPRLWDAENGTWNLPFWRREPSLSDGIRRFREDLLYVSEDRRTGIITVGIRWRDRQSAALWTNELVDRLNRQMRARAIADANANLQFLNAQVAKTQNNDLKQAIYRLIEVEIKKAMLAEVREEYALRTIDKALVPQDSDRIWPRPVLLIIGGFSLGILAALGLLAAFRLKQELRHLASTQAANVSPTPESQ